MARLNHIPLGYWVATTFFAFMTYFTLQALIFPLLFYALVGSDITEIQKNWLLIGGIFISAFGVLWISLKSVMGVPRAIWGNESFFYSFFKGISWWFISYPTAYAASMVVESILQHFVTYSPTEQVAVQVIKNFSIYPLQQGLLIFLVVFLVPLSEEILFRGMLLNTLNTKLPFVAALFLSGLIFALFHFNTAQGWSNAPLMAALTILGMFLGYVYRRYDSLWASIGLHSFFNLCSVFFLLLFDTEVN